MYKMLPIRKEEYEKCEVEIIDKEKYFWVNRNYLEVESDFANWAQIFDKCDPKNKNTEINQCLMQTINDAGCLREMIQSKKT